MFVSAQSGRLEVIEMWFLGDAALAKVKSHVGRGEQAYDMKCGVLLRKQGSAWKIAAEDCGSDGSFAGPGKASAHSAEPLEPVPAVVRFDLNKDASRSHCRSEFIANRGFHYTLGYQSPAVQRKLNINSFFNFVFLITDMDRQFLQQRKSGPKPAFSCSLERLRITR